MPSLDPQRVWRILDAHGPCDARTIAAAWAAVPVEDVFPSAEARVELALELLADRSVASYDEQARRWRAQPMPATAAARNWLIIALRADWRRARSARRALSPNDGEHDD